MFGFFGDFVSLFLKIIINQIDDFQRLGKICALGFVVHSAVKTFKILELLRKNQVRQRGQLVAKIPIDSVLDILCRHCAKLFVEFGVVVGLLEQDVDEVGYNGVLVGLRGKSGIDVDVITKSPHDALHE